MPSPFLREMKKAMARLRMSVLAHLGIRPSKQAQVMQVSSFALRRKAYDKAVGRRASSAQYPDSELLTLPLTFPEFNPVVVFETREVCHSIQWRNRRRFTRHSCTSNNV